MRFNYWSITDQVFFFLFKVPTLFWPAKSKSDVYYCRLEPETLNNPENSIFRIIESFVIKFAKKFNFHGSITDKF